MTLTAVAERIRLHLLSFEASPTINAPRNAPMKTRPYYGASAYRAGRYVNVVYVSYQGPSSLTRAEAEAYLAWLNAGNVGYHRQALRGAR